VNWNEMVQDTDPMMGFYEHGDEPLDSRTTQYCFTTWGTTEFFRKILFHWPR